MLQTFVPSFSSNDTMPFIYTTSSARDDAIRDEHANHLKSEYKIDPKEAAIKASAANQAAGIAGRMVVEFRKNQQVVGQGALQPTVSGVAKSIEGFFGSTGIFAGFGNLTAWLTDKNGFNQNQVSRSRLQNTLAQYQKQFDEKDYFYKTNVERLEKEFVEGIVECKKVIK